MVQSRLFPAQTPFEYCIQSSNEKTKKRVVELKGIMSSDFASSHIEDSGRLRLSSQRFDPACFESFSDYYAESESMMEGGDFEDLSAYGGGDVATRPMMELDAENGDLSGNGVTILPPSSEEGLALREWRRQNAIRLEEKERKEKDMLKQIIEQADAYKAEHNKTWKLKCENSRSVNREKEKLFLESSDKVHAEADKNYWKAISELVPKEVPTIEKKGKKGKEEKPSVVVIQGPKPGKPTELSRMRQVLLKLKHNPPGHMLPPPNKLGKDGSIKDNTPASSALLRGKTQATSDRNQAIAK